ncbi:alkaline phosphatase family protein [Bacillus sp. BRMEA1]|uniref:alkaline phosphatase family protein n=1 Tax=Neobacillus endophyticus TaxID=2738405 RepID=UPI00156373BD|nr:alkaline phosphatase family protein [Neobacillus endophyticus]NRD79576.1 alkaline phosphatase family protein [Neobacillus endophyticus]
MTADYLHKKRVIMLVIDSLMDMPLQEAFKGGKVPALQFFSNNGHYLPNLVSPFPTMSVNVDSTLLTGVYSDKHKLPGLVWYNKDENRIVNYGTHVRELIKLGLKQSMIDVFYNLNHQHLSKQQKTIHEVLKEKGIQSASINALLYRGAFETQLKIPFLLSFVTGLNRKLKSYSPNVFSYGAMHKLNPFKKNSFCWQKYGFNDKFSANELKYLINENKLPPFTLVYFPDLDHKVHKNGRLELKGIEKVDQQLQGILNQFPSWEDSLSNTTWIILGDNGQAWIEPNKKEALIDLRQLLNSYKIAKLKKGVSSEVEIVLCVNERMSFIYTLNPQKAPLEEIAKILQKDPRIDVIALKKGETVAVTSGMHKGKLEFHPNGDLIDEYKQCWSIEGNTEILDITIKEKSIEYGDYPDALARIYSSFYSHEGNYIIISAKPGYEFIGEGSPTHVNGAAHGGLHKQDSLVSLIVCGSDSVPKNLRILDLKEWILTLISP